MSVARSLSVELNVSKYNVSLSLSKLSGLGKTLLKTIIDDVLKGRNLRPLKTLQIYPAFLDLYNVRYTEKWIEKLDVNFLKYHVGSKPKLNIPRRRLPRNLEYLSFKVFSGDVSGMIAESLFVYFLDYLGVNIDLVAHLRPYKGRQAAFVPDFAIWDGSLAAKSLISISNYQLPVYAEVKGSAQGMNELQLERALCQLAKIIQAPQDRGLVFMAYKDPRDLNFRGVVFEVER